MDKKVKSLDITTLLSLIFYIAGICFMVMGYFFITNHGGSFALTPIDLDDNQGVGVARLLFIVGIVFAALGVITGVIIGVMYLTTDWGDEELKKKTKRAGILNIIPLTLSIPANLVTRSLVKEFVHDGPKQSKKSKKENTTESSTTKTTTTTTSTTSTSFGQTTQAQPAQQQTQYQQPAFQQATAFQAPIGESFMYQGKWMYFDGTTYYEADANNQWVVSSTIPH